MSCALNGSLALYPPLVTVICDEVLPQPNPVLPLFIFLSPATVASGSQHAPYHQNSIDFKVIAYINLPCSSLSQRVNYDKYILHGIQCSAVLHLNKWDEMCGHQVHHDG